MPLSPAELSGTCSEGLSLSEAIASGVPPGLVHSISASVSAMRAGCEPPACTGLKTSRCKSMGGECVPKSQRCTGVIRGQCSSGCLCCVAGCNTKFVGDGVCDASCNDQSHAYDGGDCRGAVRRPCSPAPATSC
jgi:hypothetical protein